MDKYIKVSDLMELIDNSQEQIDQDYKNEKICYDSMIAMTGILEVLKQKINESGDEA